MALSKIDDPIGVYHLFLNPGEVVEMRALGLSGNHSAWEGYAREVVFGYFDNAEAFGKAAAAIDMLKPDGVYFTANPCKPELRARANNRLVAATKKRPATSDKDVLLIRWLLIDADPVRPAGISASKDELDEARMVMESLSSWLEDEMSFPAGLRALSGNGYHLMYRLPDLPNSPNISGSNGMVRRVLCALSERFSTPAVKIDHVVHNAARIWKVYGTTARKGDDMAERPHRKAVIWAQNQATENGWPTLEDVAIVPLRHVEAVAALAKDDARAGGSVTSASAVSTALRGNARRTETLGELDVRRYLGKYGVTIKSVKEKGEATWYCLDACVFDSTHTGGEAAIVRSPHPPHLTYHCFHDSCNGKTWREARECISGADKIVEFYSGYDPEKAAKWKKQKKSNGGGSSGGLIQSLEILPAAPLPVANEGILMPGPVDVDPMEFFRQKGDRMKFTVQYLAQYLAAYLGPIVFSGGLFWRYADGVWRPTPPAAISQVIVWALKEEVQPAWINGTIQVLAGLVYRPDEEWPIHEYLLNVKNGMLDLRTMELLDHDAGYGSRVQWQTPYEDEAQFHLYLKSAKEMFVDKPGRLRVLQTYLGYCALNTCKHEKALFMYGTGANGKSTILHCLRNVIGDENVSALTMEDLKERFLIPTLQGKAVNIASEMDTRNSTATHILKSAISGEPITGDRKYGEPVTFKPFCKFIFAMNQPPPVVDKSHGFERKVLVINFNQRFEGPKKDDDLKFKLVEQEKEGILRWVLAGAWRVIRDRGFVLDDDVQEDADAFRASMNPMVSFLDEVCVKDKSVRTPCHAVFDEYKNWCAETGHRPMSMTRFYQQIGTDWPHVTRKKSDWREGKRRWCFVGVGIQGKPGVSMVDEG
ncbi:phage/plasmid primase, P4 family [Thermodesulfobacteriota bacterium]